MNIDNIKKELTEEQIKKFEKDINDGKEIDIESYLEPVQNYEIKFRVLHLLYQIQLEIIW